MKLTDILTKDQWIEFEKDLHERFNVNAAVFDAEGVRVTDYANWGNTLCPVIKGNPGSLSAICAVAAKDFAARAAESGQAVGDVCDAGLYKVTAPIIVGGDYLGVAGGCGPLPENGEVEEFFIHKSSGLTEEEVAKLAAEVPVISPAVQVEFKEYVTARLAEITAGKN